MLVLTRKKGERVVIDGRVVVTVVGCEGGRVRLAISAPPEVSVRRSEVQTPPALIATENPST
jgi:carbon storage regulator